MYKHESHKALSYPNWGGCQITAKEEGEKKSL